VDAADQRGAIDRMNFLAYHRAVWSRGWRDTVTFVKAHVLVGLAIAVITALATGWVSADLGEAFNTRVAVYAAVAAAAFVAYCVLWWNLMAAPWRLHEEPAARLRELDRRPDVGRLVELRERGVQLLNSRDELIWLEMDLRGWEDETVAELRKCAARSDISWFSVLGEVKPKVFADATPEINHEKAMLAERLERLLAIIRRIESGAGLNALINQEPRP
jgi:hypothetical protein